MAVRTNRITNPSFETNNTLWTANGSATLARVTTQFLVGAASLQVTASLANAGAQSPAHTVGVGVQVVASMGVRYSSGATDIVVELRNQAGTVIASQPVTLTTTWQRITLTGTTPASTTSVHIRTNRVAAAAHVYFVDAVILEQAASLVSYFDGATVDDTITDYAWTGTAHLSTSTATEKEPIVVTAYQTADPSPRAEIVLASIPALGVTTTVERIYAGNRSVVRGAKRASSPGGFTVTDYEAPLGVALTYQATSYNLAGGIVSQSPISAPITLTEASALYAWVSDPLAPASALKVIMERGAAASLTYAADGAVLNPQGRPTPIGVVGTRRDASAIPFTVITLTANDGDVFRDLALQGGVLCVRAATGTRLPRLFYLFAPSVVEEPKADGATRTWNLTGDSVAGPAASVVVPFYTYADVLDAYASYAAVKLARTTYLELLRDPI